MNGYAELVLNYDFDIRNQEILPGGTYEFTDDECAGQLWFSTGADPKGGLPGLQLWQNRSK